MSPATDSPVLTAELFHLACSAVNCSALGKRHCGLSDMARTSHLAASCGGLLLRICLCMAMVYNVDWWASGIRSDC